MYYRTQKLNKLENTGNLKYPKFGELQHIYFLEEKYSPRKMIGRRKK